MDKTKREWNHGGEVGMAGVRGRDRGKGRKLYLNNNKNFLMEKNKHLNFVNLKKRKS